jgi:hypothetical protein
MAFLRPHTAFDKHPNLPSRADEDWRQECRDYLDIQKHYDVTKVCYAICGVPYSKSMNRVPLKMLNYIVFLSDSVAFKLHGVYIWNSVLPFL